MKSLLYLSLTIPFVLNNAVAQDDANLAVIPYKQLVKARQPPPNGKGPMKFRIESNRNVSVRLIQLTLKAEGGDIAIPIDANGEFKIPYTVNLLAQNPLLVSNQPKGSLNLSFPVAIPIKKGN